MTWEDLVAVALAMATILIQQHQHLQATMAALMMAHQNLRRLNVRTTALMHHIIINSSSSSHKLHRMWAAIGAEELLLSLRL